MLSKNIVFEGFDAHAWRNLLSMFLPATPGSLGSLDRLGSLDTAGRSVSGQTKAEGTLALIVDASSRVLAAFHSERGRVHVGAYHEYSDLQSLAHTHSAARCVVVREGVPEEIAERLARRVNVHDDYVTQLLSLWEIVRSFRDAGLVRVWPERFLSVPVPRPVMVRRALDLVLPDRRSLLVVVWDGYDVWTALALRRQEGEIDAVVGPEAILRWSGPLGGDWTRDHRILHHATSECFAPVHLGVYTDVTTMTHLLREADSGAWARAVASRAIIVNPVPRTIGVALAADAARGIMRWASDITGGIETLGVLAPVFGTLRSRVSLLASVSQTLGFDPLKTLTKSLRRSSLLPPGHA